MSGPANWDNGGKSRLLLDFSVFHQYLVHMELETVGDCNLDMAVNVQPMTYFLAFNNFLQTLSWKSSQLQKHQTLLLAKIKFKICIFLQFQVAKWTCDVLCYLLWVHSNHFCAEYLKHLEEYKSKGFQFKMAIILINGKLSVKALLDLTECTYNFKKAAISLQNSKGFHLVVSKCTKKLYGWNASLFIWKELFWNYSWNAFEC